MAAAGSLALLGSITLAAQAQNRSQEVNIYSGRHYNTDKKLYAQFTRLSSEGANSPADVLVLLDAARIYRALANQYYLARLLQSNDANERANAQKVRVVWPNPTHINVSAGGGGWPAWAMPSPAACWPWG